MNSLKIYETVGFLKVNSPALGRSVEAILSQTFTLILTRTVMAVRAVVQLETTLEIHFTKQVSLF